VGSVMMIHVAKRGSKEVRLMFPTRHAIQRFQERVAPVSTAEAARRIREAGASATVRPTPRWWTPVAPAPGLSFAYPSTLPGVCFLIRDGAVLTVFERDTCRGWRSGSNEETGRRRRPAKPYHRPAPGHRFEEAA
jgi:hypothetical protein